MVLIQCRGKSTAIECRQIISIHYNLKFMCVHALICICGTFYTFADTAVDELEACGVNLSTLRDTDVDDSTRM